MTLPPQQAGGKVVMQILHSGRYGYHPFSVSSSPIRAPIAWFDPRELSTGGVADTIRDYADCAVLVCLPAKYIGVFP